MSLKDKYDFDIIENTMKERVIEVLGNKLDNIDDSVCACEECVIDMVCYALNRLKPNYSASLYGSLYSRAEAENLHEEIEEMVANAIEFVSSNSSHGS